MAAFTISGNLRLQNTSQTYVDSLIENTAEQNTSSIAEWLNTRLVMTEATAKALETSANDEQARTLLQAISTGGGFKDVYVGRTDGYMLMKTQADSDTLPADYDPRTRPWYKKAMDLGRSSLTDPYLDAASGEFIISTLAPVKQGSYQGVAGADITLKAIDDMLSVINLAGTGYAALISHEGTVLYHPNEDLIGKNISSLLGESPNLKGAAQSYEQDDTPWSASFHSISNARGVDWYLGTFVNEDKIHAPVRSAMMAGAIIAVIGLLVSLVVLHIGIRTLMAPVRRLNAAMADIGSNDADLTQRLDDSARDEFGQLASSFNQFVEKIHEVVREVQQGSNELATNVVALRDTAKTSRSSVESQQTEVDMVAAAINEMSAAAGEIAQNAQQTADAANTADGDSRASLETVSASRDAVQKLSHEVSAATEVIDALGKDVASITSVLEVIQGIAEQTNLLALNAAIEAARAGDSGRGFAVVANEVRELAQRVQGSTHEIETVVNQLNSSITRATGLMDRSNNLARTTATDAQEAASSLAKIHQNVAEISALNTQIATAAEEQSQVSSTVQRNIALLLESAMEMESQASSAHESSARLTTLGGEVQSLVERYLLEPE